MNEMGEDRSQTLFYFVPQKNFTVKRQERDVCLTLEIGPQSPTYPPIQPPIVGFVKTNVHIDFPGGKGEARCDRFYPVSPCWAPVPPALHTFYFYLTLEIGPKPPIVGFVHIDFPARKGAV